MLLQMSQITQEYQLMAGDRKKVLKEYYGRYLSEIRGLSLSSVKHYYDALNNISRRLKEKGLVQQDIYEIMDLDYLRDVREILYSDPEFVELNERGRRMYSSGLNNYCRFASGEELSGRRNSVTKMDTPFPIGKPTVLTRSAWKRSNILRLQALTFADFSCEINKNHETFIAESNNKPYMESHHAIPMKLQGTFEHSLDVYANIICLCPVCHRKIHYGLKSEKTRMIHQIFENRAERLTNSGIDLSRNEFTEVALTKTS